MIGVNSIKMLVSGIKTKPTRLIAKSRIYALTRNTHQVNH